MTARLLAVIPILVLLLCAPAYATEPSACHIGRVLNERVLIRPTADTFYSQDALNPDIVYYRGRYMLFFSGNDTPTDAGDWRTGVAVSRSPLGPFRPLHTSWPFLNGGSTVFHGRLFQMANTFSLEPSPTLYSSSTGRTWDARNVLPTVSAGWRALQTDPFLLVRNRRIVSYFAARPGPGGADLGRAALVDGQWRDFAPVLQRAPAPAWDSIDLGEPAVFRLGGRTLMLYAGLGEYGGVRQIGLARRVGTSWERCGTEPLIAATGEGWHAANAIDPEPLVVGNRLYVFYGGGRTSSLGANMRGVIGVRVYRITR